MYTGSCHCDRISFEVDGEVSEAKECNCSDCSRKGLSTDCVSLLTRMNSHFIARDMLQLAWPACAGG